MPDASVPGATASAGADFFAGAAFFAGAFFAAGAFLAVLVAGLVFVAAFLAGAFAVVFAWLVVVFLRAVEDTNTSRQGHMGAARPGMVKSRSGHSATDLVASTKRRVTSADEVPLSRRPGPPSPLASSPA